MSKLTGKIISIGELVEISEKFQKLEFVLQTDDLYPQKLQIQFTNDKTGLMKFYKVGSIVEVNVNIKGREWINPEGVAKYFLSLEAWSISSKDRTETKPIGNIEANFQEEELREYAPQDDLPF